MARNAASILRLALPAIAAAVLLALLVFLFVRTQSGEYKAGTRALAELRAMRDVDARWDSEAQALAAADNDPVIADHAGQLARSARQLQDIAGPLLGEEIPALRAAVADKARVFEALREAHRNRLVDGRARAEERAALERIGFHTLGTRMARVQGALGKRMEDALDDTDRWRVYLAFYAAALLVGVGYLAARVAQAQSALRAANETLEHRVVERTRELHEALQRLRESESQLVQTEKMSSLGQLVAGVAHEINTPLAYVKNSVANVSDRLVDLEQAIAQSEQLLALLRSPAPDADALETCFAALGQRLDTLAREGVLHDLEVLTRDGLHGIEQISELVTNLRNFSRLDRSRVASYNVNESVRGTLLIARPLLRNVTVDKRLGEIPSITCSPSQVNQVLLNLVTNAAQAMDKPDGQITITTRREGPSAVAIEIADNGRGMAPEIQSKIFDPFFTTKDVGKGTGLGLSIAYKIVAAHGGRIDVRSAPGEGAVFTVTLPLEPPPEAVAGAVRHASEEVAA